MTYVTSIRTVKGFAHCPEFSQTNSNTNNAFGMLLIWEIA